MNRNDEDLRRLLRSTPRLRSLSLVQELLGISEQCWSDDPRLAEELTGLALVITDHLKSRTLGRSLLEDVRAEAWAYLANARRIRSDLRGSREAFDRACQHRLCGAGDPSDEARFHGLLSSLLRDAQRFHEARSHLDRALEIYRDLRDRQMEARTLIKRCNLETAEGDYDAAMSSLAQAASLLSKSSKTWLEAIINRNRAVIFVGSGDAVNMRRSLKEIDPGGERGRLDRLRAIWTRSLLLGELGRLAESRRALLDARRGFVRAAIPVDVASIDLQLARVDLTLGRDSVAFRRATSAFPVFASRGLHGHTLQALDLFRQAGGWA